LEPQTSEKCAENGVPWNENNFTATFSYLLLIGTQTIYTTSATSYWLVVLSYVRNFAKGIKTRNLSFNALETGF
jgi:hypothetical protein